MIKINLIFFRLKSTSVKERKGSIVALGGFLTVIILPQLSLVMVIAILEDTLGGSSV